VHPYSKKDISSRDVFREEHGGTWEGDALFWASEAGFARRSEDGKTTFRRRQLRTEDRFETLFIWGFQTRLKHEEQKRVFRMIRVGKSGVRSTGLHAPHTFIDSPRLLRNPPTEDESAPLFAGRSQDRGVYESTAIGLLSGSMPIDVRTGCRPSVPPPTTAMGALSTISLIPETIPFQPMNINWSVSSFVREKPRQEKNGFFGKRASKDMKSGRRKLRDKK